jgi:nucleoside-diphosphate-sugar epimerase
MRVAVTGATGNVGTSVVAALAEHPEVGSILGLARRRPLLTMPKTSWVAADVISDDLVAPFRGADVVVHLAWAIQPSRDEECTYRTNVEGSERVFDAVARAGVPALVYASSVGAYSPGPKDRPVDETWPTEGIESSFYSRHKAKVERRLDLFEREHPDVRVVRLRPGLIFKSAAASEIRRLFIGPFLPSVLAQSRFLPVIPDIPGLRFQAVHSGDVGAAYAAAAVGDATGAFNIAADPVIDPAALSHQLGARRVPTPAKAVRAVADLTWRLRLQPTPPGWLDMALGVPLMDTGRAHSELGWRPRVSGVDAILELLDGLRTRDGLPTPPLDPRAGGALRWRELRSGVGAGR